MTDAHVSKLSSPEMLIPVMTKALGASAAKVPAGVLSFVSELGFSLIDVKVYEADAWSNTLNPYLLSYVEADVATALVEQVRVRYCLASCFLACLAFAVVALYGVFPSHRLSVACSSFVFHRRSSTFLVDFFSVFPFSFFASLFGVPLFIHSFFSCFLFPSCPTLHNTRCSLRSSRT